MSMFYQLLLACNITYEFSIYQWRSVVLLLGGAQNLHISKKIPKLEIFV